MRPGEGRSANQSTKGRTSSTMAIYRGTRVVRVKQSLAIRMRRSNFSNMEYQRTQLDKVVHQVNIFTSALA